MALKSTIYKARLQIADMDRPLYADHSLTGALLGCACEVRVLVRLLAFALLAPAVDHVGTLEAAGGLSDTDDPDLWQRDLTGRIVHWIEVGQPDDRRLAKACGRADRVTIIVYGASAPIWWSGLQGKVSRLRNLAVWQLPAAQSQELAGLAPRSMHLQFTVQDGQVWVGDDSRSVELALQPLQTPELGQVR